MVAARLNTSARRRKTDRIHAHFTRPSRASARLSRDRNAPGPCPGEPPLDELSVRHPGAYRIEGTDSAA